VAAEHEAFRQRVGIIDMSSFGKLEVSGQHAVALLERVCDSRIDRPPGSVIYTQFLNGRGGIVADVTVTRLDEQRFRIVTGAGTVDSDRGWLELNRGAGDGQVEIRDLSEELAVIGIWGPRARELLEFCCGEDASNRTLPFASARAFRIGGAAVLAQRITYVGELGYELYVTRGWAVQVWDRLIAAGRAHGIAPGGYRALESLRLEKGYRYFGTDLTASDTPYESGLGFCVALDKDDFNGCAALRADGAAKPERRLRTLTVGGEDYLTIYGGEAVRLDGTIVGRVRSCGYGHTVRRTIALATVPAALAHGTKLTVDMFGEYVPAVLEHDVLYDPEGTRIHA
jgi:4-methylaminobutanoate oxidase (formaldehyde-forming)